MIKCYKKKSTAAEKSARCGGGGKVMITTAGYLAIGETIMYNNGRRTTMLHGADATITMDCLSDAQYYEYQCGAVVTI